MGIKHDESTSTYKISYSKRHPITRVSYGLRRKGFKTLAEAKRAYEKLIVDVNDHIRQEIIPLWPKMLDIYFEPTRESDLSKTTLYNRETVLRRHSEKLWANRITDTITKDEIRILLQEDLRNAAEAQRKYVHKCLRGVFELALDKGYIARNPVPSMKFKVKSKIKAVLQEKDIEKLLKKAREQNWEWHPHYAIALMTGLRNGELFALRWKNVDLEQRKIIVEESWSNRDGFKCTKSGDDRVVEIPKPLLPVLRELKLKSLGGEFVLPRLSRWSKGEQARELRFFLMSIGLPPVRFHDLRASWATLLLSKGVAPSKVMAMGGWKDMDTMMIYMRKAGIDIKDSTNVLDDLCFEPANDAKIIEIR